MAGQDSLEFFARYKDWVVSRTLSVSDSTSPKEIAYFLVQVRNEVDNRAFEILGVDTKSLEAYAAKVAAGMHKGNYAQVAKAYKMLGSADTEQEISKATGGREELKPFGKAYIFRAVIQKLGIDLYVPSTDKAFSGNAKGTKPTSNVPFQSDAIAFLAKYKDWVSIKKMSIDENTKPEEIAAHLSSIRIAADRKEAEILGVNTEPLDIYASTVTENMRKSAANLEKIVAALESQECADQIGTACGPDSALTSAARTYLFSTMLQNLKIDFEVSPDTLMDMFPGLKIPKPRGNFGGKRKKKA